MKEQAMDTVNTASSSHVELASGQRWPLNWPVSFQLVGWLPALGTFGSILIGLGFVAVLNRTPDGQLIAQTVTLMASIGMAFHAAFILAPDNDLALELLLSCPRPVGWALFERLGLVFILHGGVALGFSLAGIFAVDSLPPAYMLLGWLPPALALTGLAVVTTQSSRMSSGGAMVVVLVAIGLAIVGDGLIARWPNAWPVHLYLMPGTLSTAKYLVNRLVLAGLGGLFTVMALRMLHNEARTLGLESS